MGRCNASSGLTVNGSLRHDLIWRPLIFSLLLRSHGTCQILLRTALDSHILRRSNQLVPHSKIVVVKEDVAFAERVEARAIRRIVCTVEDSIQMPPDVG